MYVHTYILLLQNSTFWPGLGKSDYFYSWAVSIYSIGELLAGLGSIFLTTSLPFFYSIPLTCLSAAAGGLIYALSMAGWMVLIARFLGGICAGLGVVLVNTYIANTTEPDDESQGKKFGLRDKLYIASSLTLNLTFVGCVGM